LVKFVPLEESPKTWAEAIACQAGYRVLDPTERIVAHGYEISAAAERMFRILTGEKA